MPAKEEYQRNKAYYTAYNRSEKHKICERRKRAKRLAESRCTRCGKPLIEGAAASKMCVNCSMENTQSKKEWREFDGANNC